MKSRVLYVLFVLYVPLILVSNAGAAKTEQRFPPPDVGPDYVFPESQQLPARVGWMVWVDTGVLVAALSAAAWIALRRRSRREMFWLSVFSVLYFGFYRKGCVCPIGAIQNITLALFDPTYVVPLFVIAFFALPLAFAIVFGRVFCSGVCPLGAVQDLVMIRPLKVPRGLDEGLGLLRYFYLGLAVLFAAMGTRFFICQYDPFVGFFRFNARFWIWVWSVALVLLSMFVGRPYCRYLCPYGALLGMLSRFSFRRVTITPDKCVVCGLCTDACPFGAIREKDEG
jgi:NAD-dependent dihydropyrimidine dehydrogenase PreA subunit